MMASAQIQRIQELVQTIALQDQPLRDLTSILAPMDKCLPYVPSRILPLVPLTSWVRNGVTVMLGFTPKQEITMAVQQTAHVGNSSQVDKCTYDKGLRPMWVCFGKS